MMEFGILKLGFVLFYTKFEKNSENTLQNLNFPKFDYRLKSTENKVSIFDVIRKKFIVLQPEEWVRQHCVHYLINHKKYPQSLINVEKELIINGLKKRYDIVIFNSDGSIHLIVECKAPSININQLTFDQIARYNLVLDATYLMVTNGINHYYCEMDMKAEAYSFLRDIPDYKQN
ncbi:type I restriction enzyme HsdR N-terminal domain-containing protein [Winogradskyella sp. SYSU M77433]|nr:type I restriction enzyme HsdR N-terminal domain-containing protein [Winogradskyella sp. SYSU M77433]MDH7912392.1 type I restriction enzyme HsdR N-terminal domain-containing protein [Winogradskyella sp. SYSU M77433]